MTDPTARKLIQRLTDAIDVLFKESVTTPHNQVIRLNGVSHPIPITSDLLARDAVYSSLMREARAYLAQPEPAGPTDDDDQLKAWRKGYVAGWDSSRLHHIPVSERLPGPEDCDSEGRCWWWYPEKSYSCGYWQWESDATERDMYSQPAAWLPAKALPLPG